MWQSLNILFWWFCCLDFIRATMFISNKTLRSRLPRYLIGEMAEWHGMNDDCDFCKKKNPFHTQEHCFKTAFSIRVDRKGTLEYTVRWDEHQTPDAFLSFSCMAIFCTSMQINLRSWVATFSQVPKLLVFMYLLSLVWVERFTKLSRLLCTQWIRRYQE